MPIGPRSFRAVVALIGVIGATASTIVPARSDAPSSTAWPDTVLARTQALALLQTLNANLLSRPSATLTLERWCADHAIAAEPRVVARRDPTADKPLPDDARAKLAVGADEPVRYRRVKLACGEHVLSEADNWYVPSRLTAAMNEMPDTTDTPFGKAVQALHFRRQTESVELLWSPLPDGWEMRGIENKAKHGSLVVPAQVLRRVSAPAGPKPDAPTNDRCGAEAS